MIDPITQCSRGLTAEQARHPSVAAIPQGVPTLVVFACIRFFKERTLLWFNFIPSHPAWPFGPIRSLQLTMRVVCNVIQFYPPPCCQGFIGLDLVTTTESSATCSFITDPCLSTCFPLASLKKEANEQASLVKQ